MANDPADRLAAPQSPNRVVIQRLSSRRSVREQLTEDVRRGLQRSHKRLPPTYFYDARGSRLFEQITRQPEYYPTRIETKLLGEHADEIMATARPEELIELGSGSSRKTRLLVAAMRRQTTGRRYVALDVSEAALRHAAGALAADLPWLEVCGLVGDFLADLDRIPRVGRRLVAFLGSTIGNLEGPARSRFLSEVAGILGDGDRLLLGVDLDKDPATLEAAYDDAAGVTAAFNRNVLRVLERELDAEVPVDDFQHVARYDPGRACVDMYLRAVRPLELRFPTLDLVVGFEAGEELHTEASCKFSRPRLAAELADAGLRLCGWDTDPRSWFALAVAGPT